MRIPLSPAESRLVELAVREADQYVKLQLGLVVQSRGYDPTKGEYRFERDAEGIVLITLDALDMVNGKRLVEPAPCS